MQLSFRIVSRNYHGNNTDSPEGCDEDCEVEKQQE